MKTIFISSTFKDMQKERDAIRDITAPLLNAEARKYNDEFDFCDLRWGINTADLEKAESSKKVLDVCLDAIDRCEPPMVVLLGYRYGSIPDPELVRIAADRKQLKIDDLEKSITALEIEYGALCDRKKIENTLFYFREIKGDIPTGYLVENNEYEEKVAELKNKVKDLTGGRIREYTLTWNDESKSFDGIRDFAERLAEDIKEKLMDEWEKTKNLTPFQLERRTHDTFIREKNAMFRARRKEAKKLIDDALSQPVTIIKGEVGSGKSTLFSHMATELTTTKWTVLPFVSGLTPESNSARDIIENTVYFIEEELHLKHYIDETEPLANEKRKHTVDEWRDKLAELCSQYTNAGKKLLIMLDAADQLIQSEERDKLYFIPTCVSENIHFVITCTTDFETPDWEYYTLKQLEDEEKLDVINGILARSNRELSDPVIDEMLEREASDKPLYLSLLVQRLLMMNSDDFVSEESTDSGITAIERSQLKLIKECPDDLNKMSVELLRKAGERINERLVSKAAQYLAVSRNGLRRKDLAALLGEEWKEVDFHHFVNYMNDCFMLRNDGRYDFTHKSIRAGFRSECRDLNGTNKEILEYFKSLQNYDMVKINEIIYHTIKADDKKFFINCIITYKYQIYGSYKDHEVSGLYTQGSSNEDKAVITNFLKGPAEYRIYELHRKYATQDTYTQCLNDNGKWIIKVLEEAQKYEFSEKLMHLYYFCGYHLYKAFGESQKEIDISISVLTANAHFSEYLYNKVEDIWRKKDLPGSYDKLANIYEYKAEDSDKLEKELEYRLKSLAMRERMAAEADELGDLSVLSSIKSKLADNYSSVAVLYEEIDGNF